MTVPAARNWPPASRNRPGGGEHDRRRTRGRCQIGLRLVTVSSAARHGRDAEEVEEEARQERAGRAPEGQEAQQPQARQDGPRGVHVRGLVRAVPVRQQQVGPRRPEQDDERGEDDLAGGHGDCDVPGFERV